MTVPWSAPDIPWDRRVTALRSYLPKSRVANRVITAMIPLGGRARDPIDGWHVVDFGSALAFRIWGTWPGWPRRLPIRLSFLVSDEGDSRRVDVDLRGTQGWYAFHLKALESMWADRCGEILTAMADALVEDD